MKKTRTLKMTFNIIVTHALVLGALASCSKSTNVGISTVEPAPKIIIPAKPEGCTASLALNFDPKAEVESGKCSFEGCLVFDQTLKETFDQYKAQFPDAQLNNTCPSEQVDTFNQSNRAHVGILWVVDDSRSMSEDQANLANNFSSFINTFKTNSINFTMGITTTDRENPKVLPVEAELTSQKLKENEDAFIKNFARRIKVGITGSGNEKGFESAEQYLASSSGKLLESQTSHLTVIYVSDEDDGSSSNARGHIVKLEGFVEEKSKLQVHSIVAHKTVLNLDGQPISSKGTKYMDAAKLKSGLVGDIESSDFAKVLKDLGNSISNLVNNFKLKSPPYLPSLEVLVNEKTLPVSEWRYDEQTQSIVFSKAPAESAEIKVKYLPR